MSVISCPRGDLAMELAKYGRFREKTTKTIMEQILEALDFIHERKIAHLDVKLNNIVVDDNLNIKLIDFEFACHKRDLKRRKSKVLFFEKKFINLYCSGKRYTSLFVARNCM